MYFASETHSRLLFKAIIESFYFAIVSRIWFILFDALSADSFLFVGFIILQLKFSEQRKKGSSVETQLRIPLLIPQMKLCYFLVEVYV